MTTSFPHDVKPSSTLTLIRGVRVGVHLIVGLVVSLLLVAVFTSPIRGHSGLTRSGKSVRTSQFLRRNFSTCSDKRLIVFEERLPEIERSEIASRGDDEDESGRILLDMTAVVERITPATVSSSSQVQSTGPLVPIPLRC